MEIKTIAYPKVNIHLAVGKRMPNGFHQIASIFQLVEDSKYYDDIAITVQISEETSIDVCGLEKIADKKNNTIYKACMLFLSAAGVNAKIKVNVIKRIPSQAGLGGGSSDAGSVLKVLNTIYPVGFNKLMDIAAEVGSDVPFFVANCKAAVVLGRGEEVYPIERKDLRICLYPNMDEKMSTAQAYQMLDSRESVRPLQSLEELTEMYKKPIEDWLFYNDFEIVNKPSSDPNMKLTGSGTCRFTIDLMESKR